jgi:hypothetical protein
VGKKRRDAARAGFISSSMRPPVTGCAVLTRLRADGSRAGQHRPLRDTARIAFVTSLVVMSGYRSGPRWLMALADCNAAETLGVFGAGIG